MLFAVVFNDNVEKSEMRKLHMQSHLEFLSSHGDNVKAAGPLSEPDSDMPYGGFWIVEAPDKEAVMMMVESDPLFATGLRESYGISKWKPVYGLFKS